MSIIVLLWFFDVKDNPNISQNQLWQRTFFVWWSILNEVGTYLQENRLNFDIKKAPCGAFV